MLTPRPPRAGAQVALLADNMSIVNFEAGQDVMLEGEPGSWVGVILSGTMVVLIKDTPIMTLATGAIVGEVALWSPDSRRTATMRGENAGVVAMLLVSELNDFVTVHGGAGLKGRHPRPASRPGGRCPSRDSRRLRRWEAYAVAGSRGRGSRGSRGTLSPSRLMAPSSQECRLGVSVSVTEL